MRALALLPVLLLVACTPSRVPPSSTVPATTVISTTGNGMTDGGGTASVRTTESASVATDYVDALADEAWAALPGVFQELGIPIGTMDARSRTMGNSELVVHRRIAGDRASQFLRCGSDATGAPRADSYRVAMTVLVTLTPEENVRTRTDTRVEAVARDPGTTGSPVRCTSTGRLEQRIVNELKLRLAAG